MFALVKSTTGYEVVAMLHILSAVAAFGPLFLYPGLHRNGETVTIARMHMRFVFPALVLLWVFGMGLAGMSDSAIEMSETWLTLSLINWVVLMAVSWFLIRPAIADTGESARSRLAAGIGVTHLLLVFGLYLMIFKPGR